MIDRCILHIGTEKTGTTSIQRFLQVNRVALGRAGYLLPKTAGLGESIRLVRAVADPSKRFGVLRGVSAQSDMVIAARQPGLRQTVSRELAAATGFHTAIMSSERLGAQITTDDEMARLRDLLVPHFRRIEIWVYLRAQVDFAVSFYSTELRNGAVRASVLPDLDRPSARRRCDYAALLKFWGDGLPAATLHPVLFARDTLKDGDVVTDFADKIGLDALQYKMPIMQNSSLSAAAQLILRAVNLQTRAGKDIDITRVVRQLDREGSGKGRLPSQAKAARFMHDCKPWNDALRAEHFPHLQDLFPDAIAAYPEKGTPTQVSDADYDRLMQAIVGCTAKPMAGRHLYDAIADEAGLRPTAITRLQRLLHRTAISPR